MGKVISDKKLSGPKASTQTKTKTKIKRAKNRFNKAKESSASLLFRCACVHVCVDVCVCMCVHKGIINMNMLQRHFVCLKCCQCTQTARRTNTDTKQYIT